MNVFVRYWELLSAVVAISFVLGGMSFGMISLNNKFDRLEVKIDQRFEKLEDYMRSHDVRISILEKK